MKFIFSSLLAVGLISVGTSVFGSKVQLKATHNHNTEHPAHQAIQFMADRLGQLSQGQLTLKIYPNATLGSQRETTELLKAGAIDIAKTNANELEAFNPLFGAFNLPYLFRDAEHYQQVLEGAVGFQVLKSPGNKGFLGLTFYNAGARSFYGRKPIQTPADIKGVKLRVQPGQTSIRMLEAMGGSPVPISLGELYTAIQQGVVFGAENNISTYVQTRHVEVAPYFSSSQHTMIPDVLLISGKTWAKLDEKQQQLVQQAADDSAQEMNQIWNQAEQDNRKKAVAMGAKFVETDRKAFTQMVESLYEHQKTNSPKVYSLVQKIRSL